MLQKIARECFDNAHLWGTETVPYFTRLYFQNLWNGSKRMEYKDTFRQLIGREDVGDAHFFSNWGLITVQSSLMPVAFIISIFVQLTHFINKLIGPLLDKIKILFKNYPQVSLAISFAKSCGLISGLLLTAGIMLFVPAIIMQALNAMVWGGILIAVIVPIALQGYFALARSPDGVEHETPYMGHKNFAALGLSVLFPWVTPSKINGLIVKAAGVFVEHAAKFSLADVLEKNFLELNLEEKKQLYLGRVNSLLDGVRKFLEKDFFLIEEDVFQVAKSYLSVVIINNYPQIVSMIKSIVKNAAVSAVQNGFETLAEKLSKLKDQWFPAEPLQNPPLNHNDDNAPGYYTQFNAVPADGSRLPLEAFYEPLSDKAPSRFKFW